jgi:acyl carrier protein
MDTNLVDDLGINSSRLVDIVLDLEDEFGIEMEDEISEKIETVGDTLRTLEILINECNL